MADRGAPPSLADSGGGAQQAGYPKPHEGWWGASAPFHLLPRLLSSPEPPALSPPHSGVLSWLLCPPDSTTSCASSSLFTNLGAHFLPIQCLFFPYPIFPPQDQRHLLCLLPCKFPGSPLMSTQGISQFAPTHEVFSHSSRPKGTAAALPSLTA